jgi:hypothetical protein
MAEPTTKKKRVETPWTQAVRVGVRKIVTGLREVSKPDLAKAGIYREKLASYESGTDPSSINLIACLIVTGIPLEVEDPETGRIWTLTCASREGQMSLPYE